MTYPISVENMAELAEWINRRREEFAREHLIKKHLVAVNVTIVDQSHLGIDAIVSLYATQPGVGLIADTR